MFFRSPRCQPGVFWGCRRHDQLDWQNHQPAAFFFGRGTYLATLCEDGVNADRYASDYILQEGTLQAKDTLTLKMAPGGGFLIRFKKVP